MTTSMKATSPKIAQVVATNQPLVQALNTGVHTNQEVRQVVAKITGQAIDPSVEIRLPFYTDFGRHLQIGKNVFINSGVTFTDLGGIQLADRVLIGPNATLVSVNHPLDPADRRNLELKPIKVDTNAWIGANATILPGVTIGENAVVAAGAIVTKDVPANTVVAGVPAKVIKKIKED